MNPIKVKKDSRGLHIAFEEILTDANFTAACRAALELTKSRHSTMPQVPVHFYTYGDTELVNVSVDETTDPDKLFAAYQAIKTSPPHMEVQDQIDHCVSINGKESGSIHWWASAADADSFYEKAIGTASTNARDDDTVTRFCVGVATGLSQVRITYHVSRSLRCTLRRIRTNISARWCRWRTGLQASPGALTPRSYDTESRVTTMQTFATRYQILRAATSTSRKHATYNPLRNQSWWVPAE
jgi:hypothetical protein